MSEQTRLELTGTQSHAIQVDPHQSVTVLLTYQPAERFDHVIDFTLAENAQLTVFHLQNNADTAMIENRIRIHQEKNSQVRFFDVVLGGARAQNDFDIVLAGSGAQCELQGVFVSTNEQSFSTQVTMRHNAPNTVSAQHYKGIANDRSTGSFCTRVIVKEGAQNIQSTQSSKNLLLSDGATVRTQPELEIYADDVQCAHGATVGALDDQALFYLRSRGVPEDVARAMLTYAFVGEQIDAITDNAVREQVLRAVLPKIEHSHLLEWGE